jgi:RNA-binding protein 23/39
MRAQRSVFITQISSRLRARDLSEFLRPCGKVREVKMVEDKVTRRSKGLAYVEFYDVESVPKAIAYSGQLLFGIPIIIQQSEADRNTLDETFFPTRKQDQVSSKLVTTV